MKITLEAEYAIRIVDYLARTGKLARASVISEEAFVPLRFAKNILQKLGKNGIVNSYKGIHGGYEVRKPLEEISLYDVITVTNGPVILNRCLMKGYECDCMSSNQCPYYEVFMNISSEIEQRLRESRFVDIISER